MARQPEGITQRFGDGIIGETHDNGIKLRPQLGATALSSKGFDETAFNEGSERDRDEVAAEWWPNGTLGNPTDLVKES